MRKRNRQVSIWMNEEEYKILEKLMKETGDSKQGIILKAFKGVKIMTSEQKKDIYEISKVFNSHVMQLRGIGTNINQLAARANIMGYKSDARKLEKIKIEVDNIKKESEELWQLIRSLISQQNHIGH